jgi:tetratricopeptide (TPR) repeat protein
VTAFQHEIQLDPLSSIAYTNMAFSYHAMGNFLAAERSAAEVLRFDPDFSLAHQFLGEAFAREGKSDAAIEEVQKAVALSQRSPTALARLGFTYGFLGDREKALDIARELEQKHHLGRAPSMFLAVVYAGLHDNDRVFHWLNRQNADERAVTFQAGAWWELQAVHDDPRWKDFLRKLRLIA